MNAVYLDWNATSPPLDTVVDAVARASRDAWGNPASVHGPGRKARRVTETAREQVACLLGVPAYDVIFTSGGTESNNLAVRSFATHAPALICSRLEHPSVIRVVEDLQAHGAVVSWLPLDARGEVRVADVRAALEEAPEPGALVILQAVNHETGVIQPVQEVIEVARTHGARVHVDAVQAVGKLDGLPWRGADSISIAAHKLRGPKGIGALYVQGCERVQPLLRGGAQERKRRPGTVSAPLAVGFGVASVWAIDGPPRYDALRPLREELEHACIALGAERNGLGRRVAHVTNVSFPDVLADELVAALDLEGVFLSSGSACSSGTPEASSVIAAMVDSRRARTSVRASLGDCTQREEIHSAIRSVRAVMERARAMDEVLAEVPIHSLQGSWKK